MPLLSLHLQYIFLPHLIMGFSSLEDYTIGSTTTAIIFHLEVCKIEMDELDELKGFRMRRFNLIQGEN